MRNESAADDCHALPTGASVRDGWNDVRSEQDAAFAASLNARLHSVVLERIIPRLAIIHQDWKSTGAATPPTAEEIEAFGQAILAADASEADRLFLRLREKGLTADELFEALLAPTARRFGELWHEDLCDFVDVTVGVNRLRIMLEMYANVPSQRGDSRRCALLISLPGERHLFGLDVVTSFLRSSGWDALLEFGRSLDEIAKLVRESWFAVVGMTVSNESRLPLAARVVEAVRRASINPRSPSWSAVGLCPGRRT